MDRYAEPDLLCYISGLVLVQYLVSQRNSESNASYVRLHRNWRELCFDFSWSFSNQLYIGRAIFAELFHNLGFAVYCFINADNLGHRLNRKWRILRESSDLEEQWKSHMYDQVLPSLKELLVCFISFHDFARILLHALQTVSSKLKRVEIAE